MLALLTAVLSLVLEHAPSRTGSVAEIHGFCCPAASGIFLEQGSHLGPLHLQADSNHWATREI